MDRNEPTIILERDYPCAVGRLWKALVDPVEMRQWFFDNIPDFRAEEGFRTEFTVDTGEREFLHLWEVTEVVEDKLLAYRWRYGGYDGAARSVFELSGDDSRCHLHFSFPIEEDFSDTVPEFTREAGLGGWEYFLNALGDHVAGESDSDTA